MKKMLWYGLHWKNIVMNVAILFAAHILGVAIHEIILLVDDSIDGVFPMGTLLTLMAVMALGLFANWQEEMQSFNLSVSMGETRKKFFISYGLQYFVLSLIDWVMTFVFYKIEFFRLSHFYGGMAVELSMNSIFHPATFILIPLVILGMGLLIGGLGLKMGSNSRWVVMIVWIALVLGLSKIGNGDFMNMLFSLPGYAYALIALGFAIITVVVSAILIRKQRVDI